LTPWWEGMGDPPKRAKDWLNQDWSPDSGTKAAHPNSRFTAPARQCPCISDEWESPQGVPISAIVFGGRRARTAPLVYESLNWQHGVFVGLSMASETTAAAAGEVGKLRRDPMAMLPFIGYHIGDYIAHWLEIGRRQGAKLPKIFHVNWFRTSAAGKFLWPGFSENMRVLEWIIERCAGRKEALESSLGLQPGEQDIDCEGLELQPGTMKELLSVVRDSWRAEIESQDEFFKEIGPKLPKEMWDEHRALKQRLGFG